MNNHQTQANDRNDTPGPDRHVERSFWQDFLTGLAFLSRLPVKTSGDFSLADASRAFGLVGLFLGALSGLVFWLASSIGLPPLPAVLVALALSTLVTGALHEDGLGDIADGFGGGWSVERKLEIMRDSHIGTYGVLALIFSVGLRVTAYASILKTDSGLLVAVGLFATIACLSRAVMAVMMYHLPLARQDGRAAEAGSPSHNNLRQGLFISALAGLIILTLTMGLAAALAGFVGILLAWLIIERVARWQIGGYTGDILGALQQTAEILALLAILTVI